MEIKALSFNIISKLSVYYQTIRYLKLSQLFYRLYYPIKSVFYPYYSKIYLYPLNDKPYFNKEYNIEIYNIKPKLIIEDGNIISFDLLSIKYTAPKDKIDWKISKHGRLWLFHLHYFDFLKDKDIDKSTALDIIMQYIDYHKDVKFISPYVSSKIVINWIEYINKNKIDSQTINRFVIKQTQYIKEFLEFNLLANHILLNYIALCWSAQFFNSKKLMKYAINKLALELDVQFLDDGLHYEKTLSYQSEITLELIKLYQFLYTTNTLNNIYNVLINNINNSFNYLFKIKFRNNYYPNFGDSNDGMSIPFDIIHSETEKLKLSIEPKHILKNGYKILNASNGLRFIINNGHILSSYQPGHSHADAFSFTADILGVPFIVDAGVSTYENNNIRHLERSTLLHNTISINQTNSINIWHSFRVAGRLKIIEHVNNENTYVVSHDGYYKRFGIIHKRYFNWDNQIQEFAITDQINNLNNTNSKFCIHFAPDIANIELIKNNEVNIKDIGVKIKFENVEIVKEKYLFCTDFNQTVEAIKLVCTMRSNTAVTKFSLFEP